MSEGLDETADTDALWDALNDTMAARCCDCPSCNFYLPEGEYQPESKCVHHAAIEALMAHAWEQGRKSGVSDAYSVPFGRTYRISENPYPVARSSKSSTPAVTTCSGDYEQQGACQLTAGEECACAANDAVAHYLDILESTSPPSKVQAVIDEMRAGISASEERE